MHKNYVLAVAYSPDGKTVLTGSGDKTARLWDASTGKPIGQPFMHQSTVSSLAYSPDGKTLLTGSWDHTAHLWDKATSKPIGDVLAHQGPVNAVAFSPDGKTALTGSWDNTARLWDSATGKPVSAAASSRNGDECRLQSRQPDHFDRKQRLLGPAVGRGRQRAGEHRVSACPVRAGRRL